MRPIILATTGMLIFLLWESKLPMTVKKEDPDCVAGEERDHASHRVKQIQFEKAEEIYLHNRRRCEQLRSVHHHNHKDLMESELKLKLSWLDLELARINMNSE